MSNIKKAFEHGKAFIAFVTCGDPSLETTEELVLAMEHAGDIIRRISPFAEAFDQFSLLCSHAVTCSSANAD